MAAVTPSDPGEAGAQSIALAGRHHRVFPFTVTGDGDTWAHNLPGLKAVAWEYLTGDNIAVTIVSTNVVFHDTANSGGTGYLHTWSRK